MPDIDLDRHEYADRDPKTGKWRRPQSKRSAKWWFVFSLVPITFIGLNAGALQASTLFIGTLVFSAFSAIFLSNWLRDIY